MNPKIRNEVKKSLLSYLRQYVPTADRVFASDDRNEASTVMRMVCTSIPNGIRWREQRSYILPEAWQWEEGSRNVVFWGTIRGKPLQADRLIHLPTYGDFQIEKICSSPGTERGKSNGSMDVDQDSISMEVNPTLTVLAIPGQDQDSLSQLAEAETEMIDDAKSIISHRSQSQKGVRIDDHYYFNDEEPELVKKKMPKGLTDYQAAWYVSDSDEDEEAGEEYSQSDSEDIEMEVEDDIPIAESSHTEVQSEIDDSTSEMHIDLSPEEEARQHTLFKEREEDAKFPDEVEYPPNIPARIRFARYRALKSFRSSPWDVDEPDDDRSPSEWSRLVKFRNWRGTCKRIEDESLVGGIKPGVRVRIYLRGCPKEVVDQPPRAVYALLKHEHKLTTLNFTITPIARDDDEDVPVVKSKDVLVVQYANRRYECRPIFSQPLSPSSENNVRKFERYLQPGRTSVASWIGNTVIGKDVPILFFRKTAHGSFYRHDFTDYRTAIDRDRFFNGTNSAYHCQASYSYRSSISGTQESRHNAIYVLQQRGYRILQACAVGVETRATRMDQGTFGNAWYGDLVARLILGYFKATFDGKIDKQDTVGMSLYKRVWPKVGV